jgi:hypothetical protein
VKTILLVHTVLFVKLFYWTLSVVLNHKVIKQCFGSWILLPSSGETEGKRTESLYVGPPDWASLRPPKRGFLFSNLRQWTKSKRTILHVSPLIWRRKAEFICLCRQQPSEQLSWKALSLCSEDVWFEYQSVATPYVTVWWADPAVPLVSDGDHRTAIHWFK